MNLYAMLAANGPQLNPDPIQYALVTPIATGQTQADPATQFMAAGAVFLGIYFLIFFNKKGRR